MNSKGWGKFCAAEGVFVRSLTGNKATKSVYLIRYAPKKESSAYTAASKPKKISVSGEIKPLKAAKTNKTAKAIKISLKKGVNYTVNDGLVNSTGDTKGSVLVQKGDKVTIWTSATAKKPASKLFTFIAS